ISNQIDNFLKSGIVKFSIPREATNNNTRLPVGYFWVKVKIHKDYNAVCKAISIQAQAVLAEFADNGNDLSHLENGLEAGTISKLIKRIATVKSVSQPYSSFGGKPEESDEAYYRRISERLRHKNRTITLWDYEHIILQEFPDIHKAKCLNHTFYEKTDDKITTNFLSPGNVVLVVIPDIVNKNVFDIYQPRVSQSTLNAVQDHVNELNSLHVNAKVINPEYREIQVDLIVKFYKGFDENYYKKVLEQDITRLLSPWAFDATASINFGHTLHKSVVINYIEKLSYVDYVEEVKLKSKLVSETIFEEVKIAETKNPLEILVSAKQHNIVPKEKSCNEKTEVPETCQT
ncbi:MAG TPA: baseplate J/gp47 family protein, partial [Draconibacterium sp.]|nr:baseplate J/gp47 family protein [Draconibacterium sp.]